MSSELISPFITTELSDLVLINPYQMDNKLNDNIFSNLKKKLLGKCFLNDGVIIDINNILTITNGKIDIENTNGCALYTVKFVCTLCRLIDNSYIIGKINRIVKRKIMIKNSSAMIYVDVTIGNINQNKFYKDNMGRLNYKNMETGENKLLERGDYVKVLIHRSQLRKNTTSIIAKASLEDI